MTKHNVKIGSRVTVAGTVLEVDPEGALLRIVGGGRMYVGLEWIYGVERQPLKQGDRATTSRGHKCEILKVVGGSAIVMWDDGGAADYWPIKELYPVGV